VFAWKENAFKAFRNLKKVMTQPPVLSLLDLNKPFVVETNTSRSSIGVVLI
jgi:hypothetical protein